MRATSLVVLLVTAVVLGACGDGAVSRDGPGNWRSDWDAVVGLVPPQNALGDDPRQLCDATLGALRIARAELPDPPDASLVGPVEGWLELAEGTFFECPPDGGDVIGFDAAYAELARFEAEIDAALPEGR